MSDQKGRASSGGGGLFAKPKVRKGGGRGAVSGLTGLPACC
jgi:hypothetical protein